MIQFKTRSVDHQRWKIRMHHKNNENPSNLAATTGARSGHGNYGAFVNVDWGAHRQDGSHEYNKHGNLLLRLQTIR